SKLVAVFVPTSPTPITGWTVMVPEDEIIQLDLTVDEAIRFILSCGVLTPSVDRGGFPANFTGPPQAGS
ncbi:MAG: hypothetical protein K8R59_12335, partial [Thermoanaerobaculales bacterium]|nr:hypothetical protein [Thermoanaerobaculales bacterium]